MTCSESKEFEDFLRESFDNDLVLRELRLSMEEKQYIQNKYPHASVKLMNDEKCLDGKLWYEIRILNELV